MNRRQFTGALTLALLAAPLAIEAQQPAKVYRVGVLGSLPNPGWDVLPERLKELGYVEGRNILFIYRWSEGDVQRFPRLIAELASLKVDVIVTIAPAARAAKEAPTTIPIVMANSGDLVRDGIVASLAHPGGHITGLSGAPSRDMPGKQMQLLKEAAPKVSTIAVLHDAASPNVANWRADYESGARSLGLALRFSPVRSSSELDDIFAGFAKGGVGAVLVGGQTFEFVHRKQIINLAARHRLPSMYGWKAGAADGGLMSYGASLRDMTLRSATYVDKILKGAKPGDLPIEQATKFELIINLNTAKTLGVTIPPSLLARADEVIQ
jgi:putative ABC transport system substrate-binding protein